MESLNGWLDKVEKEIARQEVLSEDTDRLKTQIGAMKEIKTDVDDHNRPVNNTLDIIAELVETGADVLSSSELNTLQVSQSKLYKQNLNAKILRAILTFTRAAWASGLDLIALAKVSLTTMTVSETKTIQKHC